MELCDIIFYAEFFCSCTLSVYGKRAYRPAFSIKKKLNKAAIHFGCMWMYNNIRRNIIETVFMQGK